MGGYGIVGGNLPLAAGMALSSDYRGTEEVTLCVFGDGASNQGTFGETLNLAALWSLPVVFMVTNNQFGMGTAIERHSAVTDLHRRGEGFGVPGHALRRHGRARHLRGASARRSSRRARSASRCSSRRSPTASAATRWPTPRSTAPRSRSPSGARRTRSRSSRRGSRRRAPRGGRGREDRRGGRSSASTRPCASPTRPTFPPPESLYDDIYVLGDQVEGWYSVDERSAGVHRGENERELAEARARARGRLRRRRSSRPAREDVGSTRPSDEAQAEDDDAEEAEERELMAVVRYREALNQALREEMQRDENVFLMGEDIGVFNGAFKVTDGPARGVRREARARHADLREHDRRHGRRRRDDRPAARSSS